MNELRICVEVWTSMIPNGAHGQVEVTGAVSESFIAAVTRATKVQLNPQFEGLLCGIEWQDPDSDARLMNAIDSTLTMERVVEYFGSEIDSEPATILVTDGGYGGGEDEARFWIELGGVVGLIGNAALIASTTLAGQRLLQKTRYREYRRLAKEWNDSGTVSQALSRAVEERWGWSRSEFDRAFQLGDSRGPELLRMLGYLKEPTSSPERWYKNLTDD